MSLLFGEGRGEAQVLKFQNVFGVGSIKVTSCRKKNLEKFVLWDAVEAINLINMNHKVPKLL